eukprot:10921982-Karenia_brevis.AAC.1
MAAIGNSEAAGAFFLDLEKFYEMVKHSVAMREAAATGFPMRLMHLALASYRGWRALETCGTTSIPFEVFSTIVAGCSLATTIAKVLILRPLQAASELCPRVKMWNIVDDVSGILTGPRPFVKLMLPKVVRVL